jgi:hypothetical protein
VRINGLPFTVYGLLVIEIMVNVQCSMFNEKKCSMFKAAIK